MTFRDLPASAAWRHQVARDGFELVFVRADRSGYRFEGHTAAVEDGEVWAVRYTITLDGRWATRAARIWGWSLTGEHDTRLDATGRAARRSTAHMYPSSTAVSMSISSPRHVRTPSPCTAWGCAWASRWRLPRPTYVPWTYASSGSSRPTCESTTTATASDTCTAHPHSASKLSSSTTRQCSCSTIPASPVGSTDNPTPAIRRTAEGRHAPGGRGRRPGPVFCAVGARGGTSAERSLFVSRGVFEGATRRPAGGGRSVVAGSGSGLSEEPASGCKAGHAGLRVVPAALPGSFQLSGGRRRPGAGRRSWRSGV